MTDQNSAETNGKHSETGTEPTLPITRRSAMKSASALGFGGSLLTSASGSVEAHDVSSHLAETPPMGWNSWNTFECGINEELIKDVADVMVESGMRDAGYEYVCLDDCWMLPELDANGNLVPNPEKFPSGMEALGDYIHSKSLKFGIYSTAGTTTCRRFEASINHEQQHAEQFAEWGVDYLKYDNCGNHFGIPPQTRYQRMWDALEATERDIVKSQCSWGTYESWETWAKDIGSNLWRTTFDITDAWDTGKEYGESENLMGVVNIIDYQDANNLHEYAEPGHWNDPDMLEVGNEGLTEAESRSHFSMWAIMAAPLIAGNDLRNMSKATRNILTNEEVIAVNQDPAGQQGWKIRDDGGHDGGQEVWFKPLANGDSAVALLNRAEYSEQISVEPEEMDLPSNRPYRARDLWDHSSEVLKGALSRKVPSHGTAMFRVSWPPHKIKRP